jgi:hypothetical protein
MLSLVKIFRFYILLVSIFIVSNVFVFADALTNQVVHRFFKVNAVDCGVNNKDRCLVAEYDKNLPSRPILDQLKVNVARCDVEYDLSKKVQTFDPKDESLNLSSSQINCVKNKDYENACWVSYTGVIDGYHNINVCYAKHGLPKKPLVECRNIAAGKSKNVNGNDFKASLVYFNEYNNYALNGKISAGNCPSINNINGIGYYYVLEKMLRGGTINDSICDSIKREFIAKHNLQCPDESKCPCDDNCKNNNFIPIEINKSFGCESDCADTKSIDGQKKCKLCRSRQSASEKIKKSIVLLTDCYECNQKLRQIDYYCKIAKCTEQNPYIAAFKLLTTQDEKNSYINFMRKIYGSGTYLCASSGDFHCGCAKIDYISGPRHMPRVAVKSNTKDYVKNPAENLFDNQPYVRPFYDQDMNKNNNVCGNSTLKAERGYLYRGTFFRPKLIVRYGSGETTLQFLGKTITNPNDVKKYYNLSKVHTTEIPYLFVAEWAIISKVAEKDIDIKNIDTKSATKLTIDERRDFYVNGVCMAQKKESNPTIDVSVRLEYDARNGAGSIVAYSIKTVTTDPLANQIQKPIQLSNGDKVILNNNGRVYQIFKQTNTQEWAVYTNIGSVPRPPLKYFYDNNGALLSPIKIQELPDSYNNYVSDYVNPVMMTLQPGVLQGSNGLDDEFGDEKKLPPEIDRNLVITNWVPSSFSKNSSTSFSQGVFDRRCTFLYGHRFCINDNDCDGLLNIDKKYLEYNPNITGISSCSAVSNNDYISCITAVLLRDRCTAYMGCHSNGKNIKDDSDSGCQKNLSPVIVNSVIANVNSGDYVKDFMIQKDFRFGQSICISDGIMVPDSRSNDVSGNDFLKFGKYGSEYNDYVIAFIRPFNSITANVNAPMRPLTRKGLDTILHMNLQDQLDSPYDIIPVKNEFFDNINNVVGFLKNITYYDRSSVDSKLANLYESYKVILNDCDKNGSCGDKIAIRKKLFEEMPFGTFCITKSNNKSNTWLIRESRRTQRDYDVYIPIRCQYMSTYSAGAGGAGVVTTHGISDNNTCNVDNQYYNLNVQPKYSSTGRTGSVVMRTINLNQIRNNSYGDGGIYLSTQVGERTGRCNVKFDKSRQSLRCESWYQDEVSYSGGCHDYRVLFDKDDTSLPSGLTMFNKNEFAVIYDVLQPNTTYNSIGFGKEQNWRGDSVINYFYDDYDYKNIKLYPIVEATKGFSSIDIMLNRSSGVVKDSTRNVNQDWRMFESDGEDNRVDIMKGTDFTLSNGYLIRNNNSNLDSTENAVYPPRITGYFGSRYSTSAINSESAIGASLADTCADKKDDMNCLGQQLRFARANEVYSSHLSSKYKSFSTSIYSVLMPIDGSDNLKDFSELPSSRVGFSRVFQGSSHTGELLFKLDWYKDNFRVPDFDPSDPNEICKGIGNDINNSRTKYGPYVEYECYFANGMKPSLCGDPSFADSPMCKNVQSIGGLYHINSNDSKITDSTNTNIDRYNQYNTVDSGAGAFYELGQGESRLNEDVLKKYTDGPRASGAGGTGWVKMTSANIDLVLVYDDKGVELYRYPIIDKNGAKKYVYNGKKDRQCKVRCPLINVKHSIQNIQLNGINYQGIDVICEYSGSEGTDMEVPYGSVVSPKKCVISSSQNALALNGVIIKMNNICPIMRCINGAYIDKLPFKLNSRFYGICLHSANNLQGKTEMQSIFDSDAIVYSGMALENYETASVWSNLLSVNKSYDIAGCAKSSSYYLTDSLLQMRSYEYQLQCDQNGFWRSKYIADNNNFIGDFPYVSPNSEDYYKREYNTTYRKSKSSDFVIHERSAFNSQNKNGLFLGYYCPPIDFSKYDYDAEYSGGVSWNVASERTDVFYAKNACGVERNDLTGQKSIPNVSGALPSRKCRTNGTWGAVVNPCGVTCPDPSGSLTFPSMFDEKNPIVSVNGRGCNLATGRWVD